MFMAALSSCKKDDEGGSGGGNSGPIPTSLVATWEIQGENLPKQGERDKYEKLVFVVNADDTYTLKYYKKSGGVDELTGKVVVWDSDEKHSNGQPIKNININVEKINGQPAPGGWKGIYAFEAGNILKLNLDPKVPGVIGATPSGGFGSGDSGNEGIYHYVKQ